MIFKLTAIHNAPSKSKKEERKKGVFLCFLSMAISEMNYISSDDKVSIPKEQFSDSVIQERTN